MAGGGGGSHSGDGPKKARIEIIPLIDVIFFLLATFVLFTLSLNKSNGIASVQLPKVANSIPRDPTNTITLSITEENTVGWEKDVVSLDEFVRRLGEYAARVGPDDARILINGDMNANFSSARYVMDQVVKARINKVMIETRVLPPEEQK